MTREPRWVSRDVLEALHTRQLELFGGLAGIRDDGAIESALMRPRNLWHYGEATDLLELGAAYLVALSRQQGFLDGNKRSALAAMLVFLDVNGIVVEAPAEELYANVLAAAVGEADYRAVGAWLAKWTKPAG